MNSGDIVKGKIKFVENTHIVVDLKESYSGLLHISEISDHYINNIASIFKINDIYEFWVIQVDKENKRAKLSWKKIMPRFLKNPYEFNIKETKKGFNNLKKIIAEEAICD